MLKELDQTLSEITGDPIKHDKPTWQQILDALNMTSATFKTDDEMNLAHDFMSALIREHGWVWLRENSSRAIYDWELILKKYRGDQKRKRKKKKQKRRR